MRVLWVLTFALAFSSASGASAPMPASELYLRLRLSAELPRSSARLLRHDFSLCNAQENCRPLFQASSTLEQADKNGRFRQVEYFSFNRLEAAALALGAPTSAHLPELLQGFSLKVKSTFSGPRKSSGQARLPLFAPGTAAPLRQQLSNSAADWQVAMPLPTDSNELKLHAELSILRADARNITAEVMATYPNQYQVLERLKHYQVVFVTGSDGYKAKYFGSEYYDAFQAWLTAYGIENSRLIPGANRPITEQALAFRDFFQNLKSSKPVILVNYSIANTNFLEFLLRHDSEGKARQKVAGWLAVNASFLGNPLLEDTFNDPWKRMVAETMQPAEGLADIRYVTRDQYLDENYSEILKAVKSLPAVITVSSRSSGVPSSRAQRSEELDRRGLDNDGSTGTFSHIIPGSDYVAFEGTDHEFLNKGTNAYGVDPYQAYLRLFQRLLDRAEGVQ